MKNTFKNLMNSVKLEELSNMESANVNGGEGWAHDIATGIRFLYISGPLSSNTYGALVDYYVNKALCDCK